MECSHAQRYYFGHMTNCERMRVHVRVHYIASVSTLLASP